MSKIAFFQNTLAGFLYVYTHLQAAYFENVHTLLIDQSGVTFKDLL